MNLRRVSVVAALFGVSVLVTGTMGCRGLTASDTLAEATSTSVPAATTTSAANTTTSTTIAKTPPPTNWDKISLEVEPPPSSASPSVMAYDPVTDRVILFGGKIGFVGFEGGYSSDTWAFDSSNNTWVELEPAGLVPHGRAGHVMVYVPTVARILMFGGHYYESGWTHLTDTWAYDPTTNAWAELRPSGTQPPPQVLTGEVVYDPESDKVLLLFRGSVWAYDPVLNAWSELATTGDIPTQEGYVAVYDPNTQKVVTFGGGVSVSVRTFDPATRVWTTLDPPEHRPFPRMGHAMVYHPGCGLILLFGGCIYTTGAETQYPTNLMAYDPLTNNWTKLGYADRVPYGRSGHAMVYESKSGKIVMFGGLNYSRGGELSGTWILSP